MGSSRNLDTRVCTQRCPCILMTVRTVCCLRRTYMRMSGGRSRVSWFPSIDGGSLNSLSFRAVLSSSRFQLTDMSVRLVLSPLLFRVLSPSPFSPSHIFLALITLSVTALPRTPTHLTPFRPSPLVLNRSTYISRRLSPTSPVLLLYHQPPFPSTSLARTVPNIHVGKLLLYIDCCASAT